MTQILGVGIDIVENLRFKKLIINKKFIKRVFTSDEIYRSKNIANKINFFSKRFASKEAFSKALGTGFTKGLNFKDISVINNKYGRPQIKISTKIKNILKKQFKINKTNVHLSISDEKKHSIAIVIVEKK